MVLKQGTDFTVAYKNNKKVGTAKVTIAGKGNYSGKVVKTFKIKKASIANAKMTNIKAKTYTGKKIVPKVTVKYKGKNYRDWEVASGKAATPTPGGLTLKFKRKPVNIYRKSGTVYGHKTKNWNFYHSQTALHGRVGKAIYGKPRSLGCIRNTDAQAIFIKKVIPMKTRVAIY